MNSKYFPICWCTVEGGYLPVVVGYPLGIFLSVVAPVEGSSILIILESYFGLDGCFGCFPVISLYGCHYIFNEVVYL